MCLDLVKTIFLSSKKMFCTYRYLLKRLMKVGIIEKKSTDARSRGSGPKQPFKEDNDAMVVCN